MSGRADALTADQLGPFLNGSDTQCWTVLGSHVVTVPRGRRKPLQGTRFAVWAPNARSEIGRAHV